MFCDNVCRTHHREYDVPHDDARDLEPAEDLQACRRALQAAREELDRSREQLSYFAAQVSHDLRTPLTAILANVEMLAAETAVAGDRDLAWMVEAIERGARRMDAMVEQMLCYARDGDRPVLADVALADVFERAVADLTEAVTQTRADVTVGPLPTVSGDVEQLHQVALALLSNALRFSRPGVVPRVAVGSQQLREHWRVSVADNGIGVPPDRREAMFVLFSRGDRRVGGAGVGLARAKRVVEAHGGRIGMESGPDGGTTVWFDLPA